MQIPFTRSTSLRFRKVCYPWEILISPGGITAVICHGHFSVNWFIVSHSTDAHSRYCLQGCSENNSYQSLYWYHCGWAVFSSILQGNPDATQHHSNIYFSVSSSLTPWEQTLCLTAHCGARGSAHSRYSMQQLQDQPQGYLWLAVSVWVKTCITKSFILE